MPQQKLNFLPVKGGDRKENAVLALRSSVPIHSPKVEMDNTPKKRKTTRPSAAVHDTTRKVVTQRKSGNAKGLPAKKVRRVEIEIPLAGFSRYVPGSGPPVPEISLLPPADSTAFIVAKVVLPPSADVDAYTQRRLYYIVGWTDIPIAKVAIPCTRVHDYVSPRVVENWEYEQLLKREKEEEDRQRELAAQLAAEENGIGRSSRKRGRPFAEKKRRNGGPGKAQLANTRSTTPLLSAADRELIALKQASGPSLSTPQKRKLDDLIAEDEALLDDSTAEQEIDDSAADDSEIESEGAAITAQLNAELHHIVGGESMSGVESMVPEAELSRDSSTVPVQHTTPVKQETPGPRELLIQHNISAQHNAPVQEQRQAQSEPAQTPNLRIHPLFAKTLEAETYDGPPSSGFTPVGFPRRSIAEGLEPARSSFASTPVPASIFNTSSRATPATDGSGSKKKTKDSAGKHRTRKSKLPIEPAVQQEWTVEKLLDYRQDYDAKGNLVNMYLVLWVGDWPPSQNPTWEPEDNISYELVAEFWKTRGEKEFKRQAAQNGTSRKSGGGSSSHTQSQKTKKKQPGLLPRKQYANVAEAFAGDVDEEDVAMGNYGRRRPGDAVVDDSDDYEGEERLYVTDDRDGSSPKFVDFDRNVAIYKRVFSNISRI